MFPDQPVRDKISIHALREEGDLWCWGHAACLFISIHALREEGDRLVSMYHPGLANFYPRPPRGGRRPGQFVLDCIDLFLSTPSARRATHHPAAHQVAGTISIHALREEGDSRVVALSALPSNFYPRPPRGGRPRDLADFMAMFKFLSTPSARRATCSTSVDDRRRTNFYPRPPRGGRPDDFQLFYICTMISIHALREEGDSTFAAAVQNLEKFLSTPSARRATWPL